ncbi:class I mannose-6-phosphate isomerase [Leucobacter sp. CSA1]|uniref:Class I mannose-6-phosphate isomerase n=1 Tax=Leucobacter chromiisoli TaxID=2796471 RepID=A0A934UU23_9MICO|nr:class I mannose-6-phosphate isomerase [Leucobacter chromiisoli]MBK0417527.1 class I mannose-6-phosphate isomerase [Leucobacter chromiisoli]
MNPLLLPPNPVQHFYRGGDRIAALRGIVPESDHQPEEWLGATVSRFGESSVGLAVTDDGSLLRDHVAADPAAWVGGRGSTESDTGILVKLLDARQRLPVHVHPPRDFAASHLDCPYGKTEAWYVLDAEPGGAVYVGWKEPVDRDELDRRRDAQDSEWMLDHLNRIPVEPGMAMMCPAGTAHAIGEGVFVAEVQEPTDFSILLEWSVTTSTREESHLDLGFDAVMPSVSTEALSQEQVAALISRAGQDPVSAGPVSLLPAPADPYFRVLRGASGVEVGGAHAAAGEAASGLFPQSFAVVVAMSGEGRLVPELAGGASVGIRRGEAFAVPDAFGPWRVEGNASVLACLPGAGWPETLHRGGVR